MGNYFCPLQITLIKCLKKFVCNDFIESFYHGLRIFYNHQQNNKNRKKTNRIALFIFLFSSGRVAGSSNLIYSVDVVVFNSSFQMIVEQELQWSSLYVIKARHVQVFRQFPVIKIYSSCTSTELTPVPTAQMPQKYFISG